MSKIICPNCGIQLPSKTMKIKELGIEVETEIHDKNKPLSAIKIPKGWRLLTVAEVIFLYNNYREELNMTDSFEFIEQPFISNKNFDYVARLFADSGWAFLDCNGDPSGTYASLGVRFCRNLKVRK